MFVDISITSSVGHGTSEVSEEMVEKVSSVDAGEVNGLSRAVVEGRLNNSDFFSNLTHHLSKSEKEDIVELKNVLPSLFSDVPTQILYNILYNILLNLTLTLEPLNQ